MNRQLLLNLSEITQEEKEILAGHRQIDRTLYYNPSAVPARQNEIDSSLVLENGKMIDIRRHVRFVHFPRHTHNFVEFVYMCQGSTTHIIDGRQITLNAGDFLFLNQHATQEILPCGRDDLAVNFMILPQFFDTAFRMLGNTESSLRSFLISCLTDKNTGGNYLYFNVSGILPIQNLAENLICTMLGDSPQKRLLSETTMGLLFLHLTDGTDSIRAVGGSYEENLMIRLLSYIENNYQSASLTSFAKEQSIDIYSLSRIIRRRTGKTFTALLQDKRLAQAGFLLRNTCLCASDIAAMIGYENTSYFYRMFRKAFGCTPGAYRAET